MEKYLWTYHCAPFVMPSLKCSFVPGQGWPKCILGYKRKFKHENVIMESVTYKTFVPLLCVCIRVS